ncbi:MAG: hypothetical protein ABJA67_01975 [Chthonomonadales bacterium]
MVSLLLLFVRFLITAPLPQTPESPFVVKPYIQLGDSPKLSKLESLLLVWQTPVNAGVWAVELMRAGETKWAPAAAPESRRTAVPTIQPHLIYRVALTDLTKSCSGPDISGAIRPQRTKRYDGRVSPPRI